MLCSVYIQWQGQTLWRLTVKAAGETWFADVDCTTGQVISITPATNEWHHAITPQALIDHIDATWENKPVSYG